MFSQFKTLLEGGLAHLKLPLGAAVHKTMNGVPNLYSAQLCLGIFYVGFLFK